ncbi:hypothetical protein N7454_008146 [Penicillium verhagenii]|nr:hypothetical protein N7454_008146 [Penicillium verhagenii]
MTVTETTTVIISTMITITKTSSAAAPTPSNDHHPSDHHPSSASYDLPPGFWDCIKAIIVCLGVLVLAGVGFYLWNRNHKKNVPNNADLFAAAATPQTALTFEWLRARVNGGVDEPMPVITVPVELGSIRPPQQSTSPPPGPEPAISGPARGSPTRATPTKPSTTTKPTTKPITDPEATREDPAGAANDQLQRELEGESIGDRSLVRFVQIPRGLGLPAQPTPPPVAPPKTNGTPSKSGTLSNLANVSRTAAHGMRQLSVSE